MPCEPAINLRQEIIGLDQPVPLLDGSWVPSVNLDNAASTPAFKRVGRVVDDLLTWYSSVHRGAGFKSMLSTRLYDEAHEIVAQFVEADPHSDCVIFVKNTTEAINKLANRFNFQPGDIVLTSVMEHHSNDLPWRARARVLHAGLNADGSLNMQDLERKLEQNRGKVRLVAITGASNVTGYTPPIYDIAEMAHSYGIPIFVDCAQLLPHRAIHKGKAGAARSLDFIAFSGHKAYAPFGGGALIGAQEFFNLGEPDVRGGGTIEIVTLDEVYWAEAPERDEAGSPNVIGEIAMAAALKQLCEVGMENIAAHEAELTTYALEKLNAIPGVRIAGSADPARTADRLGVITMQVGDLPHGKVAAILSFEGGVAVRNGCFCAHPYVVKLLGISDGGFKHYQQLALAHDRTELPGLVRASFGCYSNCEDVDRLVEMLERVVRGDYRGNYQVDKRTGIYTPEGFMLDQFEMVKI